MITIPELNMFNNSYYDAYKGIYSLIAHEVTQLRSMFPEGAVNNINGYKVGILTKIVYASNSFMMIIENNHDYSSAATILRSIADNLASYILIYHNRNNDEILLRHYLFLYDGLRTRLEAMQSIHPSGDGTILEREKEEIQNGVMNAITDTKKAMDFSLKEIRNNALYKNHKKEIEYLICLNHENWRYSSLKNYKQRLSWKKMYPLINGKGSSGYFLSYLSQYVHGLSSSNLIVKNTNPHTFEPMISIGVTFLGKILEFAQNDFGVPKEILQKDFFKTVYGKNHLSYVNTSYLERFVNDISKSI